MFSLANLSTRQKKCSIKDLLGAPKIKQYEKYLGLPTVVGKNRRGSLNYIKNRVWSKLQGWQELGFKELAKFNDVILAKQVWRLSHDKTFLFYRVFKSKYFPNRTIFDAKSCSGLLLGKVFKSKKDNLNGSKVESG